MFSLLESWSGILCNSASYSISMRCMILSRVRFAWLTACALVLAPVAEFPAVLEQGLDSCTCVCLTSLVLSKPLLAW